MAMASKSVGVNVNATTIDANFKVLEDARYIPVVVLGTCSSTVSLIGSCCIVYMSSHKLQFVKHRLLFCLSLADMVSLTTCLLMPFAMPSFLGLPGAVSNHASCAATGFFLHLSSKVGCIYNTYPSLYFLLLVKWNWKEQYFGGAIKIVAHTVPVAFALALDSFAVATQSINPMAGVDNLCSYCTFPLTCGSKDVGPLTLILSLAGWVSTAMVWCTARKIFQQSSRFHFQPSMSITHTISNTNNNNNDIGSTMISSAETDAAQQVATTRASAQDDADKEKNQQVGLQAILYSLAYFNTFVWPMLLVFFTFGQTPHETVQQDFFVWSILFWTFYPLQMSQSPQSVVLDNIENFDADSDRARSVQIKMSKSLETNDGRHDLGIDLPRSLVFELTALVGDLSSVFLKRVPLDSPFVPLPPAGSNTTASKDDASFAIARPNAINDEEVCRAMGKVLLKLIELSHSLSLKLGNAIVNKMKLNGKKYPAELCAGKAGKYTDYSSVTGITKDEGQSTLHFEASNEEETVYSFLASLDQLMEDIGEFASARQWTRYHLPRNLLLALIGELGELAELFQWRGDHTTIDTIKQEDFDKIGQELADVTIYLIRLADVSHVDLRAQAEAVLQDLTH